MSDRLLCFILDTVKHSAALVACVLRGRLKTVVNFLEEKSASVDLA